MENSSQAKEDITIIKRVK